MKHTLIFTILILSTTFSCQDDDMISEPANDTPVDSTAPLISLIGSAAIDLDTGDSFMDLGATAVDDMDGDLTSSIVVGGDTVDVNTEGVYVITYNVSDAAGNAATELKRTVNVTAVAHSIVGTWERLVYDEHGNSDYRTLTFEEDLSGLQKEMMPFTYNPCVHVSCPVYLATSTWHISLTYSINEANTSINIDYNYYFDYLQFSQSECEDCQSTSYYVEDVAAAVVDLEAGTITFPDSGFNASFVYTKIE